MTCFGLWLFFLVLPLSTADICTYCECDQHTKSVVCSSKSLLIRTISLLPYVESLHLKGVRLPHVPHFLFNSQLKVLRITHCGLKDLSSQNLVALPQLEVLDLSNNELESIPSNLFQTLPKLKVLILAHNRVFDVNGLAQNSDSEGKRVLQRLDMSHNPLALATSNAKLPYANQLVLRNTNIHRMNANGMFFAPSNACTKDETCRHLQFDAQAFSHLESLIVGGNDLELDYGALEKISNVSFLDLGETKLPYAFGSWLEEQSAVRSLNLSGTETQLKGETWRWCGRQLETLFIPNLNIKRLVIAENCPLKDLYVQGNAIESVNLQTRSLRVLNMSENLLTEWPAFRKGAFLELRSLSISGNLLDSIPDLALDSMPALQHLDLARNQIKEISPHAFPTLGLRLATLDLSSNRISHFPHPVLPNLLLLDLSDNYILELDSQFFAGCPQLEQLRLSRNKEIFAKCFHDKGCWTDHLGLLTELLSLDLSGCGLQEMPYLSHVRSLRSLILNDNLISDVTSRELPLDLSTLDLGNNRIHYIKNFSQQNSIRDLRLDRNPLKCDCSLHDLIGHLLNQTEIADSQLYFCYAGAWQYPLLPYLASVRPCHDDYRSFLPTLLATFLVGASVISLAFVLFVIYSKYRCRFKHVYSPLSTEFPPVRL